MSSVALVCCRGITTEIRDGPDRMYKTIQFYLSPKWIVPTDHRNGTATSYLPLSLGHTSWKYRYHI